MPLIGNQPPNCFPIVTTSALTPECQAPQYSPVRPKPVIISSMISKASNSRAISLIAGKNSFGGITLPAVPCIGSIRKAAILPVLFCFTWRRVASTQARPQDRSEEHTSELQSLPYLLSRLLL